MVERLLRKQKVAGSIPVVGFVFCFKAATRVVLSSSAAQGAMTVAANVA